MTDARDNVSVWSMWPVVAVTNVRRDTGILQRKWAATTVNVIHRVPEATSVIPGPDSATARLESAGDAVTNAPMASMASRTMVASVAFRVQARVKFAMP